MVVGLPSSTEQPCIILYLILVAVNFQKPVYPDRYLTSTRVCGGSRNVAVATIAADVPRASA